MHFAHVDGEAFNSEVVDAEMVSVSVVIVDSFSIYADTNLAGGSLLSLLLAGVGLDNPRTRNAPISRNTGIKIYDVSHFGLWLFAFVAFQPSVKLGGVVRARSGGVDPR